MRTRLVIIQISLLSLLLGASCGRFGARHEQVEADEQADPQDKTFVAQDTVPELLPDTVHLNR